MGRQVSKSASQQISKWSASRQVVSMRASQASSPLSAWHVGRTRRRTSSRQIASLSSSPRMAVRAHARMHACTSLSSSPRMVGEGTCTVRAPYVHAHARMHAGEDLHRTYMPMHVCMQVRTCTSRVPCRRSRSVPSEVALISALRRRACRCSTSQAQQPTRLAPMQSNSP